MKKKLILLLLFGLTNINVFLFAQRDDRRRAEFEELRQKREAFFNKTIGLTTDEAKAFWPLFYELEGKKIDLNRQQRRALAEFRGERDDRKGRTENDYKEVVILLAQFRIKEAKLDEEYIAKFAKILSYEKIFRYQQAEMQFARQMQTQMPNQNRERANDNNNR